jgi:hypothetical protein
MPNRMATFSLALATVLMSTWLWMLAGAAPRAAPPPRERP